MADEHEDDSGPPRKRQPISAMTFEALADFKVLLVQVDGKMDSVVQTLSRHEGVHRDHETRIRVIESSLGSFMAGYAASTSASRETKADFKWVWAALFTVLNFGWGIFVYFSK